MGNLVVNDISKTLKKKRVLVIGDTGFKGSWLCLWLHELGADIVGYALPPERKDDHFNAIHLNTKIHHIDGDIRNYKKLKEVFENFQPDFVFHLAAQALVRVSYREPKDTFDINVAGSVNVLEIVKNIDSVRSLIYVTSDKCYKNKEWIWGYRENDELGGRDPYSASKAAAEIVFYAYRNSFFSERKNLGSASVRAGNVIGGGDWAEDRIVPDCIKALNKNIPLEIRNPEATRPWQHVLEPLFGYLLLAVRLYKNPKEYSGSWNFGPGHKSFNTVYKLVKKIIHYWGSGEININSKTDHIYEAGLLHLNCDKAYNKLGWSTKWDFDRTVFEAISWYKEAKNGNIISKKQIYDYMEEIQ